MRKLRQVATGMHLLRSGRFIFNVISLVIVLALCAYLMVLIGQNREIAQFDPYQILQLSIGASDRVIKKVRRDNMCVEVVKGRK